MKQWTGIACLLFAGIFAACDKDTFENDLADVPQDKYTVEINNSGFNPTIMNAPAGQRVLWINTDNKVHTVTSSSGDLNSGDIAPGSIYNFTFTAIGEYSYSCSKHPDEKGMVSVKGVK